MGMKMILSFSFLDSSLVCKGKLNIHCWKPSSTVSWLGGSRYLKILEVLSKQLHLMFSLTWCREYKEFDDEERGWQPPDARKRRRKKNTFPGHSRCLDWGREKASPSKVFLIIFIAFNAILFQGFFSLTKQTSLTPSCYFSEKGNGSWRTRETSINSKDEQK